MDDLLKKAIIAIKSGDKNQGKQLLIKILEENSQNELAWLWMSKCVDKNEHKIDCFKRVLEINPDNITAKQELERIRTLNTIKQSPTITPAPSPKPVSALKQPPPNNTQKKKTPWLLYIFVPFIILCFACQLIGLLANTSNDATQEQTPGIRKIVRENQFGCTNREDYKKIIRYAVEEDAQAFLWALATGIEDGRCTMFELGETVFLADTAVFSGMVKIRKQGGTQEFWTAIEAVGKP